MNVVESLVQGTPAWHAHRAHHFNASDAPAMMGCSPYETRAALLHRLHTGIANEHDAGTQRLFANGHRFEALARPVAEKIIDEPLEAITVTEGRLSASLDGATFDGQILFEHKTLTAELRALLATDGITPGSALPLHYRVQMEQQLHCSGGDRVLFMASKWSDDDELIEERHCWYTGDMALRAQILAGWQQFEADLAAYVPPEVVERAIAAPQDHLPAVSVQVSGALVVASNLQEFGEKLRAFIARIPETPSTDQEFADTEAACKALKRAEEALDAAEANALASISDVNAMQRLKADYFELARTTRLMKEKLVKARKEQIREEEVRRGRNEYAAFFKAECDRLGGPFIIPAHPDFGGAIKGLKTLDSVRNAVDTLLAQSKIAVSEAGARIAANLKSIAAANAPHLFADKATLVQKQPDDLAAVIAQRLASEEQRIAAERERIRAEEAARIERERLAQAQRDADQIAVAAHMLSPTQERTESALPGTPGPCAGNVAQAAQATPSGRGEGAHAEQRAPEPPTLTLGTIQDRLGFTIHADFLTRLGFPFTPVKAAKLYHAHQFPAMCAKIAEHVLAVGEAHGGG